MATLDAKWDTSSVNHLVGLIECMSVVLTLRRTERVPDRVARHGHVFCVNENKLNHIKYGLQECLPPPPSPPSPKQNTLDQSTCMFQSVSVF